MPGGYAAPRVRRYRDFPGIWGNASWGFLGLTWLIKLTCGDEPEHRMCQPNA